MELYLYQNEHDEPAGPLSEEDVQGMLADGVLDPQTPAWHEGLTDWIAVGELFSVPGTAPEGGVPGSVPPLAPVKVALPDDPPAESVPGNPAPARPASFYASIPAAFRYPFRGNGPLLLLSATILFTVLEYLQWLPIISLIISILALGYYVACLEGIVVSSAQGEEEMPTWPEVSLDSLWADVLAPCGRFILLTFLCFLPGYLSLEQGVQAERGSWIVMGAAWLLAGSLYFPMAFLAAAMADSISGLNPMVVVPSIFKLPGPYLVTWLLLLAVMTMDVLVEMGVRRLLPLPVLPTLLSWGIGLYFLTVQMRLLGLLYYFHRRRLNWM